MGGIPGPGLLGNVPVGVAMLRDPADTLVRMQQRYGNMFSFGRGPLRYTALCGPDANRFILLDNADNFTWREALQGLTVVEGDTALVVSDGPDHARRRRMVQPAFATRAINGYAEVMVEEADRMIEALRPGDEIDVSSLMRATIRRIAIRTLFGDSLGDKADAFGDSLARALRYINSAFAMSLPLRGPGYHRARRDRDQADAIVAAEIARRRAGPPRNADLLDRLLNATDDEGGPALSEVELRDQVVSLIAAGYDTTSAVAGWAMHELLHHDGAYERAGHDDQFLDRAVNETLRLWPPGFASARRTVRSFRYDGHTIPAGATVVYSAYVTQRMPEVWPDPNSFNPDRWIGLEPDPYAFVPFGGGARRCIGFSFATTELKILIGRVAQRVQLRGTRPQAARSGFAAIAPQGGVPARVVARHH